MPSVPAASSALLPRPSTASPPSPEPRPARPGPEAPPLVPETPGPTVAEPAPPAPASTEKAVYQFTDEQGVVHVTDDLANVPERYRTQAKAR